MTKTAEKPFSVVDNPRSVPDVVLVAVFASDLGNGVPQQTQRSVKNGAVVPCAGTFRGFVVESSSKSV